LTAARLAHVALAPLAEEHPLVLAPQRLRAAAGGPHLRRDCLGSLLPHLRRDCMGSPHPHLRRDWARPSHICAGTGRLVPATLCARTAHRDRDWDYPTLGADVGGGSPSPGADVGRPGLLIALEPLHLARQNRLLRRRRTACEQTNKQTQRPAETRAESRCRCGNGSLLRHVRRTCRFASSFCIASSCMTKQRRRQLSARARGCVTLRGWAGQLRAKGLRG
jgi:hypothetical protein